MGILRYYRTVSVLPRGRVVRVAGFDVCRTSVSDLLAGITTEEKKNNADTIRWLRMYHLLSLNAAEGIPTPRRPADEDLPSWTLSGGCCYVQPSSYSVLRRDFL